MTIKSRKPSFLRRLLWCRSGLCTTATRTFGCSIWSECLTCGAISGMGKLPDPPTGGTSASKAPSGGPIESRQPGSIVYLRPGELPPVMMAARSLDELHPAFAEPIVGYMSKAGYDLMQRRGWWTTIYQSRNELTPRGGIVEVEVRLRRVVEPQ